MKKTVIALCASLLVNLINTAGLKAWGWTELVVSNGKKQAEMIQAEQTGERDSLSVLVLPLVFLRFFRRRQPIQIGRASCRERV